MLSQSSHLIAKANWDIFMIYTTKIEQQTQVLFLVALSLAVFGSVYRFTVWPGASFAKYIALCGLFLVFFRFLAVLFSMPIKSALIILLISPLILYISAKVHEHEYLLFLFIFCVSAWNVDIRTIVKIFFWINLILLVVTVLASICGIIQNKLFTRDEFDVVEAVNTQKIISRYSFGYNYPTDFAAYFTYLNLMWWYLRRGVLRWMDYIPLFFSIWFVGHYCNARTEVLIMLLIFFASLYYRLRVVKVTSLSWIERQYFTFSIPLMAALMLLFEYQYMNSTNEFYQYLDIVLSGRLHYVENAIIKKGIPWFGQYYVQHGAESKVAYNYIDCQYMIWLIIYGIITFVLLLFVYILICRKSVQSKEYHIAIILSILAIQNLIFPSLGLIKYNPFFMALFANVYSHTEEKIKARLVYAKIN